MHVNLWFDDATQRPGCDVVFNKWIIFFRVYCNRSQMTSIIVCKEQGDSGSLHAVTSSVIYYSTDLITF